MERINLNYDFCFFVKSEFDSFCHWLYSHGFDYGHAFISAEANWEYQLDMYTIVLYNYTFMSMDHVSEILDRYRYDFRSTEKDVRQSQ